MARAKVIYIFPNLIAEMAKKSESLQSLATELGLSYQSLSKRLQGVKSFELPEITLLMKHYNKSFEYLFQRDDREVG